MVETTFHPAQRLTRPAMAPSRLNLSPAVFDAAVVLLGAVLFGAAGALLGAYLMLPFNLG